MLFNVTAAKFIIILDDLSLLRSLPKAHFRMSLTDPYHYYAHIYCLSLNKGFASVNNFGHLPDTI